MDDVDLSEPSAQLESQQLDRPILYAVLLAAGTALFWLWDGIDRSPIVWDHAYFTVLSQEILDGQSIYANSFIGYPPVGLMASAAAMGIGGWFDLPTYLAPRYLAVFVGISAVVATFAITRRATQSALAGVAAGVVLGSFQVFSSSALATLEPKLVVVALGLFAGLALQRHSWWGAGAFAALAASCWQPAGLIALACGAVAIHESRTQMPKPNRPILRHPGVRYAAGLAVGAAPGIGYIAIHHAWLGFWTRAVVLPSQAQLPFAGSSPLRWLRVAKLEFPGESLLFAIAALSIALFTFHALVGRQSDRSSAWFGARHGALPLLTLLWAAFNTFEFQHAPDMLTFLPCVAFWIGWAVARCATLLPAAIPRNTSVAFAVAALAFYGYSDGARSPSLTLAEQRRLVDETLLDLSPSDRVFSFSAEEIYALSERPPAAPYLRLTDAFMPFLPEVEPRGCRGVVDRIIRERPALVVVGVWLRSSDCERRLPRRLVGQGYRLRRERPRMGPATWWILEPRRSNQAPPAARDRAASSSDER